MTKETDGPLLTAAECAARTGLTARALRVYEEFGLITPQRTPAGWRCYGKPELIRLNTIALLKSAGLTLAQIRAVTQLNRTAPSLQRILEIQVENWKTKRAEAVRGLQIVEAALKSLEVEQSLSIDQLCNLVRNMAMSNQPSASESSESHEIVLDPKLLDAYTGYYHFGEYAVLEVTSDGEQLSSKVDGDPRYAMTAECENEFAIRVINAHVRFVADAQGRIESMVIHQHGTRVFAPRIDQDTAAAVRAKLAVRLASAAPVPGSDATLRRLLDGIAVGAPDYDEMSPALTSTIQQRLQQLQAIGQYLGPITAIEFSGVGKHGWDVYQVHRENGSVQWRILLDAKGVIQNAGVMSSDSRLLLADREMSSEPCLPAPGSEAALRRFIEGIRSGAPNYDEMSPLLAQVVRQQLNQTQTLSQRLGGIVSIDYRETITERYDVFDMQREHGSTRWRIALGPDGKIVSATAVVTGMSVTAGP